MPASRTASLATLRAARAWDVLIIGGGASGEGMGRGGAASGDDAGGAAWRRVQLISCAGTLVSSSKSVVPRTGRAGSPRRGFRRPRRASPLRSSFG